MNAPFNKWEAVRRFPFAASPNDARAVEGHVAEEILKRAQKEGHRPAQPSTEWMQRSDESRRKTFRQLYFTDKTAAQIASQMGVGLPRLTALCKAEGLPPMSERNAAIKGRPGPKPGTPQKLSVPDQVWIDLWELDMTVMEAVRRAGASEASLRRAEKRLGIRFRRVHE